MTREEARNAGKADPEFNRIQGNFAVMRLPDGSYTYGLKDTSLPKSREEAAARPRVVERWVTDGSDWDQLFL